jgi:1-acyl-sn-glycerol-3-phosphate acyltransferase
VSAPVTVEDTALARGVLDVVEGLVGELGTRPPSGIGLGDHLERELGIGSLERVELLGRLEQAFGVRLPDGALTEAETSGDLVGLIAAGGARPGLATDRAPRPAVGGVAAPAAARTLVEMLRWHAESTPERVHVVLGTDESPQPSITYGALWRDATRVGAGLRAQGVAAGERVAIMLPTGPAFFSTFFGTLLAGAVAVPIYPPFRPDRLADYARRQIGILRNAEASALVTSGEAERLARLLRRSVPSLRRVCTAEAIRGEGHGAATPARAGPDDAPALVQYTSGSTGEPKGVLLTHANVLANIRAFGRALAIGPDDVAVSWLPLYHDMGLIGSWLGSLYHGVPAVILSPLAFLARPARWLWALHTHRGTVSPAPNFAFDLCVKRIRDDEIRGLDLSAWRLALNGSEPVSPETIARFTDRFATYGFAPRAMCPVYGLAEAAVALTATPPGRGPRVDTVARDRFQRDRVAEPPGPAEPAPLRFVSCGRPIPGHEIRVVDAAGRPLGERREGRIHFRGPSVTRGYFRNPAATRAALAGGWMDSGDLGYWAGGELHVTGRQKDLVIRAGRNLYPQEIEEVVGDVAGVRKGCVAAFGVMDEAIGTERLIVIAESRAATPDAREAVRRAVTETVLAATGVPPDTVVVAAPGAVLKTSSGKVRRSATREAYLRGALGRARPPVQLQRVRLALDALRAQARGAGGRLARLAFVAWTGVVLAVALPVLALIVTSLPGPGLLARAVRRWCRLVLAAVGCAPRVDGLSNLPRVGPFVLVANHASYLDVVVLLAAIPRDLRFVAKRELLRTPLVGTVIRRVGHLTVDRFDLARSLADAALVTPALQGGAALAVFPEGTFVRAPGLLPFRLGAFRAAVDTGCPIVPVAIRGTRDILPADSWLPSPGAIAVEVGPPITPADRHWRDVLRVRDLAREAISRALETEGTAPGAGGAGVR